MQVRALLLGLLLRVGVSVRRVMRRWRAVIAAYACRAADITTTSWMLRVFLMINS